MGGVRVTLNSRIILRQNGTTLKTMLYLLFCTVLYKSIVHSVSVMLVAVKTVNGGDVLRVLRKRSFAPPFLLNLFGSLDNFLLLLSVLEFQIVVK